MVCCKSDIYIVPVFEGKRVGLLVGNNDDAARWEPSGDRWEQVLVLEVEVGS